jgi:hypothetical protein
MLQIGREFMLTFDIGKLPERYLDCHEKRHELNLQHRLSSALPGRDGVSDLQDCWPRSPDH